MPNKSILISSLAAAAVIGGLAYWVWPRDETVTPVPTPHAQIQEKTTNTIAHEWQWQNFSKIKSAPNAGEDTVPANVVAIYRILQGMKLDENGRVIPDQ